MKSIFSISLKEIKNIMILDESNIKDYKLEDVIIPLVGADYEF